MLASRTLVPWSGISGEGAAKVDMHIFRENTEDIYAGIEWEAGTPEAEKFYRFCMMKWEWLKCAFLKVLRLV